MSVIRYHKGKSNRKGTDYELVLSMLFLKRAVDSKIDFRLATERTKDEKFDDLYFETKERENVYYVQAKHIDDISKKITYQDLASTSDSYYSLLKYFISYCRIKAKEEADSWDNTRFLICTTIELDDLNFHEIETIEVNDCKDIFEGLGICYKLQIPSPKVRTNLFQHAYSDLKKLSRKLAELFLEKKKINVDQMPIIKRYHVALIRDLVTEKNKHELALHREFLDNSSGLSVNAQKFRNLFYESAREYLKKKKSKGPKNGDTVLAKYEAVINEEIADENARCSFWNEIANVKLPVVGGFGDLHIKGEKKSKDYVEEITKVIGEASKKITTVTKNSDFGKVFFKLFGYVLTFQGKKVTFNDHFATSENLPKLFETLRESLLKCLGCVTNKEFQGTKLNFSFSEADENSIFKEKVFWRLEEDFSDDKNIDAAIRDFLNKLVFVKTLKENDLGNRIRDEIRKEFGNRDGDSIHTSLQDRMIIWSKYLEDDQGYYLTKNDNPYAVTMSEHPRSIWFNVQEPLSSFTGRKDELKELHSRLQNTVSQSDSRGKSRKIVLLTGMGGIGKTQLARQYAKEYKEHYECNVLWIDSEQSKIEESFLSLAHRLNIERDTNKEGRFKTNIVMDVYKYFAKKKCLFVFDNAEEYDEIKSYITDVSRDANKPHIIITSRNRHLISTVEESSVDQMDLPLFSESDAICFAKKTIKQNHCLEGDLMELANILGYLPLALNHAVMYINELNASGNQGMDVGEYVKLYKKSDEEVKSFMHAKLMICGGTNIFVTFTMAVDQIRNKSEYGHVALEILNSLAYLTPSSNPSEMFLKLTLDKFGRDRAQVVLGRSIVLLHTYAMIEVDTKRSQIKIHRLLQQVIRLSLCSKGEEELYLSKAMELVYNQFEAYRRDVSDRNYGRICKMSEHLTILWNHAAKYGSLIDEYYFKYLDIHRSPLHLLSISGDRKAIEAILTHLKYDSNRFEDVHQRMNVVLNSINRLKLCFTPMHEAALNGHVQVCKVLFSFGAKIQTTGYPYETPLHLAAQYGRREVTEFLVKHCGTNRRLLNYRRLTPTELAVLFGHSELVDILNNDYSVVESEGN